MVEQSNTAVGRAKGFSRALIALMSQAPPMLRAPALPLAP
jgi:hypothetical protein